MSFGGLILTINGRNELAKAELGEVFQFTEVVLGDGEFRGSFSNKTSLEHEVMRLSITSIKRKESEVIVESDFDSKSAQQAFYFREIGIIGNGKLCYYDNAGADAEYIDPDSSAVVKQKRLRFVLTINSDVELNVELAEGLYALDQDLKQVEAKIPAAVRVKGNAEGAYRTGDVNLTAENIGLGNVPNVSTNNQTPTFTQASDRANIGSGERLSVIFSKLMKWYADLKTVAFSGKYTDLTDKPTIPAAVRVKGNAESVYRTGDVNLTAANIGAVNKGGDSIHGRLNFINDGDIRFVTPDVTGGHARGINFIDKNGTDIRGGIGVTGNGGILDGIYLSIGTAYPWSNNSGIYITNSFIKWKGSNLVTENSGTATAATKATQDGSGNNIVNTYAKKSESAAYSLVENGDFNSMTTPGLYTMKGSSTLNKPTNGGYHGLIVLRSDSGVYVQQIATKEGTTEVYVRYGSSSSWGAWERLLRGGDMVASATKATQDSNGNVIVNTYARKEWNYAGAVEPRGGKLLIDIRDLSSHQEFLFVLWTAPDYNELEVYKTRLIPWAMLGTSEPYTKIYLHTEGAAHISVYRESGIPTVKVINDSYDYYMYTYVR